MTENSIIFIGGGKCSRWVADQVDLDVLGFFDTDKTRSTFGSLNEAIDANADVNVDKIQPAHEISPILTYP